MTATSTLDALVVGSGPSAIATSIALSGYRPHYVRGCKLYNERLERELASVDDLLAADLTSLSHGLPQRQSNNRLAVLFDLLFHPNADYTELAEPHDQPTQTCLGLARVNRSHAHVVVGDEAAGGSWHTMRGSTLALSPGYWMELPGLEMNASKLSEPPRSWRPTRESRRSRRGRNEMARYYRGLPKHFGLGGFVSDRVVSAREDDGAWAIETRDGRSYRARRLILAVGTSGVKKRIGVAGEDLPHVSHTCGGALDSAEETRTLLVIGAGLSATDCIVEALQAGWTVFHSFRGPAASAKIVTKFGGDHWIRSGMYPEYNALAAKITGDFDGTTMFDKMRRFRFSEMATSYTPHADTELREIGRDGSFTLRRGSGAFAAEVSGHAARVAILVGSRPDLSFLSQEVRDTLERAGPPPRENADGIRSTHEVFVDVDPWSMEAKAVPKLHALGPLRGDNFCRFAIHDGWGVLRAMEQNGELGEVVNPKKKRGQKKAKTEL